VLRVIFGRVGRFFFVALGLETEEVSGLSRVLGLHADLSAHDVEFRRSLERFNSLDFPTHSLQIYIDLLYLIEGAVEVALVLTSTSRFGFIL